MKDKIKLLITFLLLSIISFISNLAILLITLLLIIIYINIVFQMHSRIKIAKKILIAFAPVMIPLSIMHYLTGMLSRTHSFDSALILFFRSFDMTLITLIFVEQTNMIRALSFSKNLTFLFTIAYAQTEVYRKILSDFEEAKKSRTLSYESYSIRVLGVVRQGSFFILRAIHDSEETSLAMKSRGFGL